MKIYLKIIILLTSFVSINLYAEKIKYQEQAVCKINKDIMFIKDLKKHETLLKILVMLDDSKYKASFTLEDIINTKTQIEAPLPKRYQVSVTEDEIKEVYETFAARDQFSLLEYKKFLKKNKLLPSDVKNFIKDSLIVEKLHNKIFGRRIPVSISEINNFFSITNNYLIEVQTQTYAVLQLSFEKKKSKKENFEKIAKIEKIFKKKRDIIETPMILSRKNLNVKIKALVINPEDKSEEWIKDFILINLSKNIIGPIFHKKHINLFKIIKIKRHLSKEDVKMKIKHIIIKKKKIINENSFLFLKNRTHKLIEAKKDENDSYFKTIWISCDEIPKYLFKKINELDEDGPGAIFETKIGWHFVKVLKKRYKINTPINKNLQSQIKLQKLIKIRKEWMKSIKKKANIKRYKYTCSSLKRN